MLSLLSAERSFHDPWVGHGWLNRRLSIHRRRMALALRLAALRRPARAPRDLPAGAKPILAALLRDGAVAVPEFLDPARFAALAAAAGALAAERPPGPPPPSDPGEEDAELALWPAAALPPEALSLADNPLLAALSRTATGFPPDPATLALRRARGGRAPALAPLRPALGRESFHPGFRFWLTLRTTEPGGGGVLAVPGSHLPGPLRLSWEQVMADRLAGLHGEAPNKDGRFRVTRAELGAILPGAEPVILAAPPNTLVAVDTLGFHGRVPLPEGAESLVLEGRAPARPFALLGS